MEDIPKKRRRALTPDARERELCRLAEELAEKQMREGTASAGVITHYLKMASARERLERDILSGKKKLIEAQTDSIIATANRDEMYLEAIQAMKRYSGNQDE